MRLTSSFPAAAVWAVIILYVVWSSGLGSEKRSATAAGELSVHISDSTEVDIVRTGAVEKWIREAGLWPAGKPIDEVDTRAITEIVASKDFVRDVRAYVDLRGTVSVDVRQRIPFVRFINDSGYDSYLTSDGYVVPVAGHSAHYVPVVTGSFALPFERKFSGELESYIAENEKKADKNYIFLSKLINFVEYIGGDDFWSSQIVQIDVTTPRTRSSHLAYEPQIELIPRVGGHVVILGSLEGFERPLLPLR